VKKVLTEYDPPIGRAGNVFSVTTNCVSHARRIEGVVLSESCDTWREWDGEFRVGYGFM
jgi:hypothetical protein